MSVIFVFLDGVGLAPESVHNPLASAPMPTLHTLLGGPLTGEQARQSSGLLLRGIDANLGVAGLPQSGTGQVALLAGVNAPAMVGRHQPYYPPVALRALLAEQNIFHMARMRGLRPVFVNAFTPGYWQALADRRIRRAASVIAAEGAGLRLRTLDDLAAGQALMWDITGDVLATRGEAMSMLPITPHQAGERLARIARVYDLVFFECFLPDLVGHHRIPLSAATILERIDALFGGVLALQHPDDTLVMTSDHGNIEDQTVPGHTRNPVPLLVVGPGVYAFAGVQDTTGVAQAIQAALQ